MGEATVYRRTEQHRDRWSVFGADEGIRHLSNRLSATQLKQYPIFEGFKDRFLETISPDVSVASWREGAVLFEEGSYIDVAFFLVEGSAAAYLAKHAAPEGRTGPIFAGPSTVAEHAGETGTVLRDDRSTVHFRRSEQGAAAGETTFLSTLDFDLVGEGDVVPLGPGECFGEIGALNGWPQSVTVKTLSESVLVHVRVPALRLMKRQSSTFRDRVNAVYRQRALLPQLRATPLFRGVPEEVVADLASRVELVSLEPGEKLIEEGAAVDALHLVRSGFMRLAQRVGEGRAAVSYLSKGMTVGEIELLIDGVDRSRCTGRVQGVVATRPRWCESSSSLKASDGVFQPRVFRGRRLSVAATAATSLALCRLRSVPLGKYWRSRPLVFSFVPRCHGLRGSQKKTCSPVSIRS